MQKYNRPVKQRQLAAEGVSASPLRSSLQDPETSRSENLQGEPAIENCRSLLLFRYKSKHSLVVC